MKAKGIRLRTDLILTLVACVAASLCVLCGCRGRQQQQVKLELYVPCGIEAPTKDAVELFKQRYPNIEPVLLVENISVLVPRIEKGDKPDVFLCIGDIEMERLEKKGVVGRQSTFCFTCLALVVPDGNPANVQSLEDLAKDSVKYVGIGDRSMSVGYYAEELLKGMGIWEKVEPKKVSPKQPIQLFHFTRQKKVDAALAYSPPFLATDRREHHEEVAAGIRAVEILVHGAEACVTVPLPAASIKGCKHPEEAGLFIDFIREEPVQKIFQDFGFLSLGEAKCF